METLSKPVYLKDSEIQMNRKNRISDFELMQSVIHSVGDTVRCIQLDRDLWRIYLTNDESKQTLLTQGVDINNQNFNVYEQNPYVTGSKSPADRVLKVTVSGVPLSVDDKEILAMLTKLGANPKSDLQYEKIRNPMTKKMTGVLNGNRYIYLEPFPDNKFLPRTSYCAGIQCRIYHYGQPNPPNENAEFVGVLTTPPMNARKKLNAKFAFNRGTPRVMNNALPMLKNAPITISYSKANKMLFQISTHVKYLYLVKNSILQNRPSSV